MALDAYTTCPCGSGKKLKFCCCKDVLHDFEKVLRAVEGDQRAAAMDQINRMIADHGPRHALLALQAELYLSLEDLEAAERSANQLLAALPHSSIGLAIQAILLSSKRELDAAIERLQDALENAEQVLARIAYTAIGIVAGALIGEQRILAGRGHLLFQVGLAAGRDRHPIDLLMELNSLTGIPIVWKQDLRYSDAPEGVPWQGEFRAAMKSAGRGAWRAACESLKSLSGKVRDQASVWRNIAILHGWLGQDEKAASAWRKFATLPSVPLDAAIEAEAMALELEPTTPADMVDVIRLTYQVPNTDDLMERLLSDRRAASLSVDLSQLAEEGEPPPKGAFLVFDREMPGESDEISSVRQLPIAIANCFVYGRQTDRPARFEVILERGSEYASRQAEIAARFAGLIGTLDKSETIDQVDKLESETSPKLRIPANVGEKRARELIDEQRRQVFLERWPEIKLAAFGGKSAREAASQRELQHRVLAAILNLELSIDESMPGSGFDFNELRRSLNLPERGVTELPSEGIPALSLISLGRLVYSKLSDDNLLKAYQRLATHGYRSALYGCGREVAGRPSMSDRIDLAEVLEILVTLAPDADAALQFVDMGRQLSITRGHSPAKWYLHEFQLRLRRHEADECDRLMKLISSRHIKEPGVAQALYRVLMQHGLINEDGTPAHRGAVPNAQEPAMPTPAASGSTIWTPDAVPAGPKSESKLWLPGS